MQHSFSQVPKAEIQRASFDRSHGYKTTFDAGWLVPVFVDEVLPGDTFTLNMSALARLATPLKPIMDNIFLDSFFFFVPNRLIWSNWQKFNGEQDNPGDSTAFVVPHIDVLNAAVGSLYDYFGIPTGVLNALACNSLHMRAYNLIYNDWFRDENLQNSVVVDIDDGPDNMADYVLLRRGRRFDYFTSSLPFPQKGAAVSIPLGTSAPVVLDTSATGNARFPVFVDPQSAWAPYLGTEPVVEVVGPDDAGRLQTNVSNTQVAIDPKGTLMADLSAATAATINSLRQAFQIQRLLERDARGGTRYTEIIRAHFGVVSPDARLQRPEYLGGGSTPVNVHPVPQTSVSAATPQGNLAAFGVSVSHGNGFSKSFVEHGVVIGMVSARADLTYQNGLDRMWSRHTRFDFYWPALAHLGEQAVLNQELVATGTSPADSNVFGYQERYAEYRYKQSRITGLFRSSAAGTLDIWHLSTYYPVGSGAPGLNAAFIVDDPPVDRVIAVPSEPHFILDCYFRLKTARPMPVFGVPGLIDHF